MRTAAAARHKSRREPASAAEPVPPADIGQPADGLSTAAGQDSADGGHHADALARAKGAYMPPAYPAVPLLLGVCLRQHQPQSRGACRMSHCQ
jgi:hypothetical protein